MNWQTLIDETAFAAVLPSEYRYLARPVRDGLTAFLQGLPEEIQASLLSRQLQLSPSASVSERLGKLAQDCPVLQKLGQILARDQRLAPELRHHLRRLESHAPSVPMEMIQATLDRELGSLERLGVALAPAALAEASVAVVIPFRKQGRLQGDEPRHGVFKILKPGIEQRLELELAQLEQVGIHLDQRCDELGIPHLDYQESFQQVRDKLREEIRLDHEQRHLAQARKFFARQPRVQIPILFDFCSRRVTAMERISGGKVTDQHWSPRGDRRQFAQLVVQALIAQPVFSPHGEALFHGDPHAGNLFRTADHRLAILDWSLAGCLGERERVATIQILLGAATLNARHIAKVLEGLARRQAVDPAALSLAIRKWLRKIRYGGIPGLSWLVGLLDEAVQTARLRLSPDMMLFRKTLHTLEGVVAAMGADALDADLVMAAEFLRHFAQEWPQRCLAAPTSRDFATRLSNLDLTRTVLSAPFTAARFWSGQTRDLMEVCGAAYRRSYAEKE